MNRLDGKVAIVFGAGPNIGGTIAHFFARGGARVAIAGVNGKGAGATADFRRDRGFGALPWTGNATQESDVAHIIADSGRGFGQVDCLINPAGKVHWSSVLDMQVGDWNEAVLSFPTAGMLTTKHAAKAM